MYNTDDHLELLRAHHPEHISGLGLKVTIHKRIFWGRLKLTKGSLTAPRSACWVLLVIHHFCLLCTLYDHSCVISVIALRRHVNSLLGRWRVSHVFRRTTGRRQQPFKATYFYSLCDVHKWAVIVSLWPVLFAIISVKLVKIAATPNHPLCLVRLLLFSAL